jgi:transcriptional regulator with XRE-family HTH domain
MTMLRQHRLAKGLTAARIGKRIGVSRAAVSSWETGRCLPHPRYIPKLARVLGLKPMVLIRILSPAASEVAAAVA